jgi:hypothetical protein
MISGVTRVTQPTPIDWTDRSSLLAVVQAGGASPLAVAERAARRVVPLVAVRSDHPERFERLNTLLAALDVVVAFTRGQAVSRFTLRQVRDLSYDVADAAGHLPAADAVLYAASAALDADPVRSLVQSLRSAVEAFPEQAPLIEADLGGGATPLWPHGEPDWYRGGMEHFERERVRLPVLFRLP